MAAFAHPAKTQKIEQRITRPTLHSSLPRFWLTTASRSLVSVASAVCSTALLVSCPMRAAGQLDTVPTTVHGEIQSDRLSVPGEPALPARLGPQDARSIELAERGDLPDAPGVSSSLAGSGEPMPEMAAEPAAGDPRRAPGQVGRTLSPYDNVVNVGTIAPPQTARDKVVGALRTSGAPFSLAGSVLAAGYSHVVDGSPNYGTNSVAFGQRVGAAVARGTSQTIFSAGVMAPVLHQDFRYYQLGPQLPLVNRVGYAITRPLVGRTDSGKTTPNIALLSGYLGAAFLTRTYYPERNQSVSEVMKTYGGSLGGAALGYAVHEFFPDLLAAVHLKK